MNRFDYRGAFWFPVEPNELWDTIERFDQFESWWAWLRDFGADSDRLVAGNVLHATVIPPVPYRLALDIRLEGSLRPHVLEATIDGDARGFAVIRLEPVDDGTQVAVVWSLGMVSTPLRIAALVAYPLMRWGTTAWWRWRSPGSASRRWRAHGMVAPVSASSFSPVPRDEGAKALANWFD